MADEAPLKILRRGIRAWNAWRMRNPHTKPQLSGANLTWANLCRGGPPRGVPHGGALRPVLPSASCCLLIHWTVTVTKI
jgi:hypothetical protein